MRSTNACSSTAPSSSNGVTMAVRMAPSSGTSPVSQPRWPRPSAHAAAHARAPRSKRCRSGAGGLAERHRGARADRGGRRACAGACRTGTSRCSTPSARTARPRSSSARSGTSARASRSRSAAAGAATHATAGSSPSSACGSSSRSATRPSRAYLESVKHIGPRGAEMLVSATAPTRCWRRSTATRRRVLRGVPGIGPRRIGGAVRSWRDQRALRELRLFLDTHGVDAAVRGPDRAALRAPASIARLQREPYAICELDGIGFATADALARALDTPPDAPDRLAAGVLHALDQAQADGHCHLPRAELARAARAAARRRGRVDGAIDAAGGARPGRGRRRRARRRSPPGRARATPRRRTCGGCSTPSPRCGSTRPSAPASGPLRPQRRPVARRDAGARAPPVDPHGRARDRQERDDAHARRPAEGRPAQRPAVRADRQGRPPARRAHRRRGDDDPPAARVGARRGFTRDADQPIEGCDMLIVDEASMLSVHLAEALLAAVGPRTHVLLVGDVDQLAPVGPGRVLEDLLELEPPASVPSTRLTEVFRQAARSLIVRAAHAINAGEPPRRRGRRGRRARLLPHRARRRRRRSSPRSASSPRRACRRTTASTPPPTSRCSRRCTRARSGSTR